MDLTNFQRHVVLCAWTPIARVALQELLAAGRQVAIITENPDDVPLIKELGNPQNVFITVGNITGEEALNRVNVTQATTVIAASDDDTHNLIIALEIRRLNPYARIVVSTKRKELRTTLTSSGVTYVASPFELSGRLVASAAFEPEVARFVEDVTSGADDVNGDPDDPGYDLQQFTLQPNTPMCGQLLGTINQQLRQMEGPLIVAVSKHLGNGKYKMFPNPPDNLALAGYDALVVLGNRNENQRAASYFGVTQGG